MVAGTCNCEHSVWAEVPTTSLARARVPCESNKNSSYPDSR